MDNLVLDVQFSNESATEPVTLTEVKTWLKIDVADDDSILDMLIPAAREDLENYLNISLIDRTVKAWLQIGLDEIRLPYGPVQTVTSVTNSATSELIQSFTLKYEMFKAIDPCSEITVQYTAGFNGNLPYHFSFALLNQIAWQYEHRGDELEQQSSLSPEVMRKLKPYRRVT